MDYYVFFSFYHIHFCKLWRAYFSNMTFAMPGTMDLKPFWCHILLILISMHTWNFILWILKTTSKFEKKRTMIRLHKEFDQLCLSNRQVLFHWYLACWTLAWRSRPNSIYIVLVQQQWYFVTKIVLTYCEKKIVLVIEKNFWNSRLKAENLQNFWDH